jgi:hypothetical protein
MKGYISRSEQRVFACFGRARYCLDCSHLIRCISWCSLLTPSRPAKTKDEPACVGSSFIWFLCSHFRIWE